MMRRNKLETFYLLSLKTHYQQTWQSVDKGWQALTHELLRVKV